MSSSDRQLVLFDLDHTILDVDSDEAWVEFLIERGVLDPAGFGRDNRALVERYARGEATPVGFTHFYLATLAPHEPALLEAWRADYVPAKIVPAIRAKARALIARHRDEGALMVLTTATSRFLTMPIARELGLEHLIATEPEMKDGRYTGRAAGVVNMREGKVTRLVEWLAARGTPFQGFARSTFYSDSRNDLPLLSRVTHPVVVNPDPELAAVARARGWPSLALA